MRFNLLLIGILITVNITACASPSVLPPPTETIAALPPTETPPPPTMAPTETAIPPTATLEPTPTEIPGKIVIPLTSMEKKIPWLPMDGRVRPVVNYVSFAHNKPPFDNALVRGAFSYAIDKEVLVEMASKYSHIECFSATVLTPPQVLGLDLNGAVGANFDPSKAKELLAQAGYSDPSSFPKVMFLVNARGDVAPGARFNIATKMAEMWKNYLGIEVEVKVSSQTARAAMDANNPDLFWVWGWAADMNDPQNFITELFQTDKPYNWGKYSNPDFDKLVKLADNPSNPEFRQRKYIEAERILTEIDFAMIPLYHTTANIP